MGCLPKCLPFRPYSPVYFDFAETRFPNGILAFRRPQPYAPPYHSLFSGDAVESQVVGISGGQGHYQFTVRTTNRTLYDDGCTTYHVRIIPPKNTFLDLFGLGGRSPDHPTEEQTKAAASVLKQHSINHQPLKIGYLGGGLYPDPRQKCLYHGTGMRFDAPDWVWVRQDGRKGLYPHLDKP